MQSRTCLLALDSALLCMACGRPGPESAATSAAARTAESGVATTCLNADGPAGRTSNDLIQSAFGAGSMEAPDAFHSPAVAHVLEELDPEVGPCFVFRLHAAIDGDPVNRSRTDRQRNEIKIYDRSPPDLLGYENTRFMYGWRFKVGSDVPITRRFLHVFQLKAAKSPDDQHPILTFTAETARGQDRLQIRHAISTDDELLAEIDWRDVAGRWIDAEVRVTYADRGSLSVTLNRADGVRLVQVQRSGDIDLWRGGGFVRPKWGFYRSLVEPGVRVNAEDSVRIANIAVTRGHDADSSCR